MTIWKAWDLAQARRNKRKQPTHKDHPVEKSFTSGLMDERVSLLVTEIRRRIRRLFAKAEWENDDLCYHDKEK
ncbi:hypothetical protein [Bacillus sp. JCM 19041]|uniref:hypothetical protein n=1 Tax=Bacillus sp. JCM 19041 TaxID=1460637 RepID=UPI0006D148E6